jgi:hypothetical protein
VRRRHSGRHVRDEELAFLLCGGFAHRAAHGVCAHAVCVVADDVAAMPATSPALPTQASTAALALR